MVDEQLESGALPGWASVALQERPESRAAARAAIMDAVRREPLPRPRLSRFISRMPSMRLSRWPRRGLLTPFGTAAVAVVLAAMVSLQSVRSVRSLGGGIDSLAVQFAAETVGDSVVPVEAGFLARTADDSLLLDTLRVVEFVLRGPTVRSAEVVGDFNAWRRRATVLHQDADGAWRGRALVPRDMVRFAYVVERAEGAARVAATRVRIDSI